MKADVISFLRVFDRERKRLLHSECEMSCSGSEETMRNEMSKSELISVLYVFMPDEIYFG